MTTATRRNDAPYIDLADPTVSTRAPAVKQARAESWYAKTSYGIAVLRYEDMRKLLLHKSLRQGSHAWPAHNRVTGIFADWWERTILVKEGEDHSRLRRLVNPAFSISIIEAMRPQFEVIAEALVDTFEARGSCDFMAEFADPYASQVLCYVLGLPQSEWARILRLSATMGLALGVDFKRHEDAINAATVDMFAYVDELIAEKRAKSGDDFMSRLAAATEVEGGLSEEELRDMVMMLIFAGIDTTRNQIGLGMETFLDHPEQWQLLADDPSLAANAVEEVMRLRPTITWVTREAIESFEYKDLRIEKGTTLHLLSECAGTDEATFTPGFDITADRKRHFGFGGGIHHCLGHAIARGDMTVAFTVLPRRLKNIRRAGPGSWLPDSGNTGPISLPITFSN